MDQLDYYLRASVMVVVCGLMVLMVAAWKGTQMTAADLHEISAWLAPHRHAWYALPLVMLAFVVLGLVPVVLLIAATGIAFGPVLGPVYAMAGCLASASVGFAIGRRMGLRRVERLGGERITRIHRALKRNGTLAVFFVRKVPAPFTLANIVVGASGVRYRDFMVGTLLGMGAFVIALAGFGYQLTKLVHSPSPTTLIAATLFVAVPLTLAWLINRTLRPCEVGWMSGAAQRVARVDGTPSPADAIVQPGKNCWRVERAHQFYCVQDAADYFRLARQALLDARDTVFMLGWDILAAVDLQPGAQASDAPDPTRRTARLRRTAAPAAPLLHSDLGLRRTLHARARSVVAMAARLAHASPRPVRVRRSPSRRRLPPSEGSSSSTISWHSAAASI